MSEALYCVYVVLYPTCPTCEAGDHTYSAVFATREEAQAYIDSDIRRKCWQIEREIIGQPLRLPGRKDG